LTGERHHPQRAIVEVRTSGVGLAWRVRPVPGSSRVAAGPETGLEFDEVPEALRYVGEGLAHGKVVVTTD
jgi:hypothetical protein